MSEYREVEQPFLRQLAGLGWTVIELLSGEFSAYPLAIEARAPHRLHRR